MKNPDGKPLRIVSTSDNGGNVYAGKEYYAVVLSNLAIAQSNLVKQGKDSAMPHFIAIVKELERVYGFRFEVIPEDASTKA